MHACIAGSSAVDLGSTIREDVDVVTYQYFCDDDGPTEVSRPMGTAPGCVACPVCDEPARRVFSGPMVSRGDQNARRLIESTEATSDRPQVVTEIPSAGRRRPGQPMAPPNPLLQKLPRP